MSSLENLKPLEGEITTIGDICHNLIGEKREIVELIIRELNRAGINNKYIILGTLGTIGKESGFKIVSEGTNYSYERLKNKSGSVPRRVWKRFKEQGFGHPRDNHLKELSGGGPNGVALFNIAYGYSKNQGSERLKIPVLVNGKINKELYNPGLSGYRYRGRGPVQVTFKSGYKASLRALKIPLREVMCNIEEKGAERLLSIQLTAGYMKSTLKRGIRKLGEPENITDGLIFAIRCVGGLGFEFSKLKTGYERAKPWIIDHFRISEEVLK